jgi:Response regulators consisting of a CheY-like receiver domain and a winged-helix DNA-binding domain
MRLLLVEDEKDLATSLADGLQHDGYQVFIAGNGRQAITMLTESDFDLMILDRDLPLLSGDGVCRAIRSLGMSVPIIMLTAAASVKDRVEGLDLGADDYLTKPFAYVELLARLRALSRRSKDVHSVFEVADLRLDRTRRVVERSGYPLFLTQKEYGVLEVLMGAFGGIVTVDELLDEVWGSALYTKKGVVKTAIYTLRKRLGEPDLIEAISGRGYRLVEPGKL